jgi:imidazolonepropionase-like amidohydrolase
MDHLKSSSADNTLRALKAAQGLLHAGFTTVRSAGEADIYYPAIAVAKSIQRKEFYGPRIVGAGHYISVTGGGGDINFIAPENCLCCNADGIIANGANEMIAAVRKEIKYGSDWIKILATGAFMSSSTNAKDSPENT